MLTYWIPNEPSMLPASPSHQIGVGGFVLNDKREVHVYIILFLDWEWLILHLFFFLIVLTIFRSLW